MDDESLIAIELTESRKASGFSRERVAQSIGVSAKTIERWEKSGRIGPAELRQVRGFYAALSGKVTSLDNDVPRGTTELEEATWVPSNLGALAKRFERDMARLGADDQELDHIDAVLHSTHVARLIHQGPDGSKRSPEERLAEFQLQMETMEHWLRLRMERRGATPAVIGGESTSPTRGLDDILDQRTIEGEIKVGTEPPESDQRVAGRGRRGR